MLRLLDEERGHLSNFGSKGERSTFLWLSGCTYFLTGYLYRSWSMSLHSLYIYQGWWKKTLRKFEDKLSLNVKVSKGRCPKALDDFANCSVWCQVGRFTNAVCYQYLMIFRLLEYSLATVLFFHLHSIRNQIYRAGRAIYSNRPTKVLLHWTGFKFGIGPKNTAHNFNKMQKGNVIAFYKIKRLTLVMFLLGFSIYHFWNHGQLMNIRYPKHE